MSEKLDNIQIEEFLLDFEQNSTVEILEEGSNEKNEIIQIAKARGINLKNNTDLSGMKCIYAFADRPNKNKAILPEKELLRALPTMIGKPINIGHRREYVIGHILDYKYVQKDKKVIMYGAIYRSNFAEEWEQAKKDFKAKKLNVSFEIWSPEDKRKYNKDGTYELLHQEIAGCAVLFRDEDPAFKGAKVLALAKNISNREPELVYAKKYKCSEVLTSNGVLKCINCGKCKEETDSLETSDTTTVETLTKETTIIAKVACSNCKEEIEYNGIGDINCPKCFAILDRSGNMIYPPQVKDFKVLCPSCKINRWRIIKKDETNAKLRCLHCSKEYQVTFDTTKPDEILKKVNFVYTGSITCYQCNNRNYVSGISSMSERTVKCKRCGLEFSYDIMREMYKKISKIEEIKTEDIKSSEKGGNKMAKEKKIEKKVENIVEQKDKSKVKEEKKEVKVKVEEKPKVKEAPKAGDTPKPEEKVKKAEVKKEEAKVEKKPEKVEAKKEVKPDDKKKVDKPTEKKVEAKKEEVKKEKQPEKVEEAKETKEQTYAKGIRKLASEIKSLKKQLELYKANAKEIIKRRDEIGDVELTDEDILNDDKFGKAKAEKENLLLKAQLETGSETVGTKVKGEEYYAKKREAIEKEAFKHIKK